MTENVGDYYPGERTMYFKEVLIEFVVYRFSESPTKISMGIFKKRNQ